jgi:hypothetical protein
MTKLNFTTKTAIAVYAMLAVLLSGCENKPENYTQKKIGIIRDANVAPTSFNEQMKVQVKTDSQFFIIGTNHKMPQLTLGDSLTGLFSGSTLEYIIDSRGEQYRVR